MAILGMGPRVRWAGDLLKARESAGRAAEIVDLRQDLVGLLAARALFPPHRYARHPADASWRP